MCLWRKYYKGVKDSKGNLIRLSLEEAAEKVGINKRSLDDYLLQLRIGKRYGFDFTKNRNSKIGVLRQFVKKEKLKEKSKHKHTKANSDIDFLSHACPMEVDQGESCSLSDLIEGNF